MNAVEFIKQDHRQIEELFGSFLDAESESTQEEVFQQIETGLTAHSDMEEQVFYPALQGVAPDEVKEALEEHAEVKQMLADLLDADVNDEDFDSRFQKLMRSIIMYKRRSRQTASWKSQQNIWTTIGCRRWPMKCAASNAGSKTTWLLDHDK
jgi:hemerythrin superfamily protein